MKLLCADYSNSGEVAFSVIGDNALLRNNDDFYVPGFTRRLSCVPQLVLKVGKIGKCVSERFAGRYYEEIGVGVRFYADDLAEELSAKGLPADMACAFDGAAAISMFRKWDAGYSGIAYSLRVNDEVVFEGKADELALSPDRLVARMSEYCMLKIGDLIFCGNSFRQEDLSIGDRLQVFLGEECLLDFSVK